MKEDEWVDPKIRMVMLEGGVISWYDKYFHFWQIGNIHEIYLKQEGYDESIVVVLNDGREGESYLESGEDNNLKSVLQRAYYNARKVIKEGQSDYNKYLKPTLLKQKEE